MPSRIASSGAARAGAVSDRLERDAALAQAQPRARRRARVPVRARGCEGPRGAARQRCVQIERRCGTPPAPTARGSAGSARRKLLEPREVEDALVLVDRLADQRRGARERHLHARRRERLGGVEAGPAAAPVGHQSRPGDRGRARRSRSRRRRPSARRRRPAAGGAEPRAGRHDHAVGRSEQRIVLVDPVIRARRRRPPPRAGASSRRGSARRSRRERGREPASASWPPSRSLSSASVTAEPPSAAASAAASPGRAGADDETSRACIGVARAGGHRCARARARVLQACDREPEVVVADAALVAADAGDALVVAALAQLARQLGVGDQRALSCRPHRRRRRRSGRRPRPARARASVTISGTAQARRAARAPAPRIRSRATGGGGTM